MRLTLITTIVATLALTVSLIGQDAAREQKLQQAIDLLETKGDAARAMPLLEEVAKSADQNLAARALLYLGQAQERQGSDAARATYERIVRQFANQGAVVEQARTRLIALGAAAPHMANAAQRVLWNLPQRSYAYGNLSRDARLFLFTDSAGDLHIRDLAQGTTRTLVKHQGDSYAESAALSADGQQVAFAWYNDASSAYELHVGRIGATELANRRVIPNIKADWIGVHDWSADGQLLALDFFPVDGTAEIDVVNVTDGSRRALKTGPRILVDRLAFSPDGQNLAAGIRSLENGALDIYLLPVRGGHEIPAVLHRADDVLVGWAPDGRLLFTSDRTSSVGLYGLSVPAPSGASDPVLLRANIGVIDSRGVSASGALFAVVDPEPASTDIQIAELDFLTGRWIEQPKEVVREYFIGGNRAPEWSPDGRTLAYISRRGATTRSFYSVHLRSIETGRARELKPKLAGISALRWTPKGDALILTGSAYDARGGLWRMDLETGDLTQFDGGSNFGPSVVVGWSADGDELFLRRNVSLAETVIVGKVISTGAERELVRGPRAGDEAIQGGRVTPDGRRLIYRQVVSAGSTPAPAVVAFIERDLQTGAEREVARGHLAALNISPNGEYFGTGLNDPTTSVRSFGVLPTSGGQFRELIRTTIPKEVLTGASSTNVLSMAGWAADSRSFFVRKVVGDSAELWWVAVDGRAQPRRVVEKWTGVNIRVHPDGRRFVFETRQQPTRASELWVFENLLSKRAKSGARP